MALKAGYQGVKKSLLDKLLQMSGSLIIKSLGTALSLSDAGELRVRNASDSHSGVVQPDGETTFIEGGLLKAASGGAEVKTLTYTGDGANTSTIDFSQETQLPKVILGIAGTSGSGYYMSSTPILYGIQNIVWAYWMAVSGSSQSIGKANKLSYTDENSKLHVTGDNPDEAFNSDNVEWTVYYI